MAVLTPSGRASAVTPRAPLGSVRRSIAGQRTPLVAQSRASSLVIHETVHYVLSSFGPSLPVEVRERLQCRTGGVSLDPSGWGVVITSSTVFLWHLCGSKAPPWVELPLPPGEEWSAELVCICDGGVVAMSAQGAVVGWPAFQQGTVGACRGQAALKGEDKVRSSVPLQRGCVLGTAEGRLFVVTTQETLFAWDARPTSPGVLHPPRCGVSVRQGGVTVAECGGGEPSVGVLSFFSRRVSSLLFRGPSEQKLQRLVPSSSGDGQVLVLFEKSVQMRSFLPSEEKVLFECDLSTVLKVALATAMLPSSESSEAALLAEVMVMEFVDVCDGMAGGVVLLVAAGNPLAGVDMQLYLAVVEAEGKGENPKVGEIINLSLFVREEDGADLLEKYRVLRSERGRGVLVCAPDSMMLCDLSRPGPHQAIPVDCSRVGQLLGAGCYGDQTLIVSSGSGVISVRPSSVAMETTPVRSVSVETGGLAPTPRVPGGTPAQSRSDSRELQCLKQAFALFCEHKQSAAEEVCRKGLPQSAFNHQGECRGDSAVAELSKAIIDDYPAADPRWAESSNLRGSASQRSVIIQYQLQDKQFVHKCFLEFLREVGLWACLSTRPAQGCHITTDALREHGEKLATAVALKDAHSGLEPFTSHSLQGGLSVVDQGIKRVLQLRKISSRSNRLTDQDLFYRKVSRVDELLWALAADLEERWLVSEDQPSRLWALHQCASVCKAMLDCSLDYRREFVHVFLAGQSSLGHSWTADTSAQGARTAVCSILSQLFSEAGSAPDTNQLWRLAAELVELVLSEYTLQLSGGHKEARPTLDEEFQKESRQLIEPFVRGNQFKLAIGLAERFQNFPILVEVCALSGDQHQLHDFVDRFKDQGFAEVLYKHYLEEGQYSVLFSQPVEHRPLLQQFLADHARPNLQWIHSVNSGQFMDAARALGALTREEQGLARRKTLLSMEKLCLLAAGGESLDRVDKELKVVAFQENLPLEDEEGSTGVVLSPKELVKAYTSVGLAASEEQKVQNFMCALDLINLVYEDRPTECQELKMDVWVRALLMDKWCELGREEPLNPLKVLPLTFFFKLMVAVLEHLDTHQHADADLSQYTVSRHFLLDDDRVSEIAADAAAQFLLKAGYEHVARSMDAAGLEAMT